MVLASSLCHVGVLDYRFKFAASYGDSNCFEEISVCSGTYSVIWFQFSHPIIQGNAINHMAFLIDFRFLFTGFELCIKR